jgi:DNA-binding CsgD family transcriptional regulator
LERCILKATKSNWYIFKRRCNFSNAAIFVFESFRLALLRMVPMTDDLIDRIYESSFVPELWPGILDALSNIAGARGGVLFAAHSKVLNWTASANLAETFKAYVEDGWLRRCTRRACWLAHTHPGFLVEHDVWKQEELESNPIYRDFLMPRGLGWSAGMALPMPTGDNIVFSLERDFAKGPVERERIGILDGLRPHLSRSALVSARLRLEHARGAADTLALIGLPAVVLDQDGAVVWANRLAESLLDFVRWRASNRVAFVDSAANALLCEAIREPAASAERSIQSFPVRNAEGTSTRVAHVLPVRGTAQDIFERCKTVVVLTPVTLAQAPPVELVRSLFDLTPAEARVARSLSAGETLDDIAETGGVSRNTVRTQLRGVMEKTGCTRQAELVSLLANLSLPRDDVTNLADGAIPKVPKVAGNAAR